MNPGVLTALLAERVMGWHACPDRFLLGKRQWKPRHYFQPAERAADAFQLLEAANADEYTIARIAGGKCSVSVRIAGRLGEALESSEALAITLATSRARLASTRMRKGASERHANRS